MANFASGIGDVSDQRMAVQPNPVDTGAASEISSASNILGVLGTTAAQGYSQAQSLQKVQQNAGHLAGYAQDLLRISDLEQQGALKPDTALRQYRLRTAQMIANHPLQQEEIFKTYGNIVEKAGLGQNVAKDYNQQQDNANALRMSALTDAQKAGWGSPNDPPEVQQQLAEKHQQFLFAQSQMQAANALLEHKTKENQLVSSGLAIQNERASLANSSITMQRNRIGLAQDQAQQQFLAGAQGLSDAYFGKWQNDTGNILKGVQAGTIKPEDAIKQVQEQQAAIHQQVGTLAVAHSNPGAIEALSKPIDMLAQATIDQLSGKTGNEVTSNTIANITGLKNLQILQKDPDFLTLTAVSKLLPAAAGALQQNIGDAAVNLLKRNKVIPSQPGSATMDTKPGDPTHNDDANHNKGVDQYFQIIKAGVSNISAGNKDPDLQTEVSGNINNILKGVGVYSKTMTSPTELNSAVKFFADPQIGNYLKANPDLIKGDVAVQAKVAYEQDYQRAVLPLVQEEFLNAKVEVGSKVDNTSPAAMRFGGVISPDERSSSSWIHPEFNGTGISFVANDPTKGETNREALRLNREVAPVVNNLIRANAHFGGNTDYKKSYDQFIEQLQPRLDPDTVPVKSAEEAAKELTGV